MSDAEYTKILEEEAVKANKKQEFIAEQLLNTFDSIVNTPPFSESSNPELTLEFIQLLLGVYSVEEIRNQQKEMKIWKFSNPKKIKNKNGYTNKCQFINNWMKKSRSKIYIER
jgi:hypothetical protein